MDMRIEQKLHKQYNIVLDYEEELDDGWLFMFAVSKKDEAKNESDRFTIELSFAYWKKVTEEEVEPVEMARFALQFLLDREPYTTIDRHVITSHIKRTYSEFEVELRVR
jgi:hypothetical protein